MADGFGAQALSFAAVLELQADRLVEERLLNRFLAHYWRASSGAVGV